MKRILPFILIWIVTAANAQWSQLSGPPGGNMIDLERIASGKMYSVANQTLFESSNSGASWTQTVITTPTANFRLDDLAVDAGTGKLYAIEYSRLYTSTDGTNWTKVSTDGQFYGMYRVTPFGPDGFIAISGWNGVYVSKDGGVNFTKILDDNIYDQNRITTNSNGDLFAPTQSGIKRYLYPGAAGTFSSANWETVLTAPTNLYELNLGVDNSNNLYAYVGGNDGSNDIQALLLSTSANNGATSTWLPFVRTGMTGGFYFSAQWDKNGSKIYMINNNDGGKIYSRDGNNQATTNSSLTLAHVSSGSTYIYVNSPSTTTGLNIGDRISGTGIPPFAYISDIVSSTELYISQPATANSGPATLTVTTLTVPWTQVDFPPRVELEANMSNIAFVSATEYVIGTDRAGIYRTTNSGSTFSQATGLKIGNGTNVLVTNSGRIIYIPDNYSRGYWTSTDNGINWTFEPLSSGVRKLLKLSDGSILVYSEKVYRSADDGNTFTDVSGTLGNFFDIKEDPSTPLKLYTVIYNEMRTSTDGGLNWSAPISITGMPPNFGWELIDIDAGGNVYGLIYDNDDNDNNRGHVYKVTGGVGTLLPNEPWSEVEYFYPNNLFIQGGNLYLSYDQAIYKTANDGANWATSSFSGPYVFPIKQGAYSGIVISRQGTVYITQDDGKTFNSTSLPSPNSYLTKVSIDLSGNLIGSATNSPAVKFTGSLTVDPATLPPFIDFNWQPTNGPYGGHTSKAIKDNSSNVFTYGNGTIYKTTTFANWQKVNVLDQNGNNAYIYDIMFDDATNTLYANDYSWIYSSINSGATWTKINTLPLEEGGRYIIKEAGGNLLYVSHSNKIRVSTDGGVSFGSPAYTLSNGNLERISVTSSAIFISVNDYDAGFIRKLFRSTDNGNNWSEVAQPVPFLNNMSTDPANVYVWDGGNQLYKSIDNGDNWVSIAGDFTDGINYNNKVVTAPNGDLFIYGYDGKVFKSVNDGANWVLVGTITGIYDVIDSNWVGTRMVFATNDGIYTSDDDGVTFTNRSTGITNINPNDLKLIGNQRLIASGSKPYVSTDFQNWSPANGLGNYINGIIELSSGELIAWSCGEIFRSIDSGQTWTMQSSNTCVDQLYTADGVNFYNRQYSKIQTSTDLSTWTDIIPLGLPTTGYFQLVSDNNSVVFYVLLDGSNGREAYQILFGSAIKLNFITNPASLHNIDGKVIIYDSQGTIYETVDGSVWTNNGAPSGDKLIIASNNYYFVPSYGGVLWLSRDEGQSWQEVGFDASNSTFTDVVINEFDGYAYGSITRSVVRKSANIVIPDDATNPLATGFVPANNAINVNESTNLTITFDEAVIPQAAKTLRILDVANPNVVIASFDVTMGVQNGKSFTYDLPNDLSFLKTYFVVIDNGSFEDIFGNAYAGFLNNTSWRFTIREQPDTQAPVIAMVTTSLNLEKGVTKTFEVTVTDDKIVPTDKTKFWYRGITKLETVAFTSANMTVSSGSGTTSSNFTVTAAESWFDEMGMEFYIESEDDAGNKTDFPSGAYNYSYINYPSGTSPAIPSGRISFGGLESNYRIISIPYTLGDAQVTTVLNELGAVDKTKWRMFNYDPTNSEFIENPTSFERGKGYWLNVRNSPGNILVEGATTPPNNKTAFFVLRLFQGWNQVGNPYPVTIDWSQAQATNANVQVLKTFNGTAYTNATQLSPFEGGFTFVSTVTSQSQPYIDLKIRFKDVLTGGRKLEVLGSDLSENNWAVSINATSNEITNTFGGVGMHENAKLDWDQYDDINPPRFLNSAEIAFTKDTELGLPLAKDVVPTTDEFEWEFNAISSEGTTVLSWENTIIAGNKDLMLFDLDNQILVNMKNQATYSFSSPVDKKFKVYFGNDLENKIKPTSVSLGKPYPNPATNVSLIKYTLPENQSSYRTVLEVYNSVGKKVATLSNGDLAPGFYTAEWDVANSQNGLYFYRLTVIENGKLNAITEKIIINR